MTCANCGDTRQENYCPNCGEKKFHPGSLTAKHYVEESLEGLFHFDNKFLRSIKTLITRPGQLSVDYAEGRRVRFMRPLPLFLIVNLVVFLLLFNNPFSIPLQNYITYSPFTNFNTVELVNEKIAAEKTTHTQYEQRFNDASHSRSKSLLIAFIPAYALLFALLLFNKKKTTVEHLVFATHYVTFILVAMLATFYLLGLPLELATEYFGLHFYFDDFALVFYTALFGAYLFFAIRRFYKTRNWQNVFVSALVALNFFTLLFLYRMLLFYSIVRFGH
jgi:hypothetical protein